MISHYEGNIKELILHLKFHSYRAGATLAARLIVSRLDASQFDIVTSVPTTAARRRQRGYNQAELIAREIALYVDLPYVPLLGRHGQVRQMGATRTDRLKQLAGSFYSLRDCAGLRVLVIDDVLTTGATLSECAAELKAAGAKRVWGAVLAKH